MRNAVLGAGITGLACGSVLQAAGEEAIIFEKENQPGGIARSHVINGYVFDQAGGHVFNTKFDDVRQWFFSFLPENEWQFTVRQCKIWYRPDVIMNYPFELGLYVLSSDEIIECLSDFFDQQLRCEPEPDNLHDWFIWKFGKGIAERYLIPYNQKIWAQNLKLVSPLWIQGKMPLPSAREILSAVLKRDSSEKTMAHSKYYYPRRGGLQTWINRVAASLPGVQLSTPAAAIEKVDGGWRINGGPLCQRLISTLPLPELIRLLGAVVPAGVVAAVNKLCCNSFTATYYNFDLAKKIGDFFSWMYLPDLSVHTNRFVHFSGLSEGNCPPGQACLLVDNIGIWEKEFVTADARKYIPELPDPLTIWHNQYAYVVYDLNYQEAVKVVRGWCEDFGIILLGRFARWEYPNMDICVKQVFDWAKSAGIKK